MASTARLSAYAEIDRLVCGAGLIPNETATRAFVLQTAARRLTSGAPLSSAIVNALLACRCARVALFTGFVVPNACPHGENDGPLGTVALARALRRLGFDVLTYADPQAVDHTTWLAAEIEAGVPVDPIPAGRSAELAETIGVAIAIEKPGMNEKGFLHAWNGARIEAGSIPVDAAFAAMNDAHKLTIAIGDRGNEIGFGAIRNELLSLTPEAGRCACGCGGGTAAATPAALLFPSAVSNWGAYGLCAGLALAAGDRSLALRPEEEKRLLNVAAVRGCRDGLLGATAFGVDGIKGSTSVRIVDSLHRLVETWFRRR